MSENNGNGYASRDIFLAPMKRRFKDVYLPNKEIKVRIRSLSEGEKEAYEAGLVNSKGDVTRETMLNSRPRLIVACLVDGNGDPLLSEADTHKLRELDGSDLALLQDECQLLCGFKREAVDEAEKNSEAAPVAS